MAIFSRYLILTGYKIIILLRYGKLLPSHCNFAHVFKGRAGFHQILGREPQQAKRFFKQIAIGLPFGVLFAVAMFVNFTSGWDKRVESITKTYPSFKSLILVLIIAVLAIVVFISVFSVKVKWEKHEQKYRELLSRSKSESKSQP